MLLSMHLPSISEIVQVIRRRLIQIVVEPVGEQQARVPSPPEHDLLLRIVIAEIIARNVNFDPFVDVSEVLICQCCLIVFLVPQDKYLSAVLCGYDMRPASSDSARIRSSGCFRMSSFFVIA